MLPKDEAAEEFVFGDDIYLDANELDQVFIVDEYVVLPLFSGCLGEVESLSLSLFPLSFSCTA